MNRRKFIRNTALAGVLTAISPSLAGATKDHSRGRVRNLKLVLRGVSYTDAIRILSQSSLSKLTNSSVHQVRCVNTSYTHTEGVSALLSSLKEDAKLIRSEELPCITLTEAVDHIMDNPAESLSVYQMHHTEIGHSSMKEMEERLLAFFELMHQHFNPRYDRITITADLGANNYLNSSGGKDHSGPDSLDTFVLFLGGKSAAITQRIFKQEEVFKQKF